MALPLSRRAALFALGSTVLLGSCTIASDGKNTPDSASASEGALKTVTPGKLTIATGEPAYSPWVENNDPASGKGFEAAVAYADLFRGMPFLIVLYLIGFGIPALNPTTRIPAALLGTVALVLTYSSYVAEVLRAGLEAVHPSQRFAARSLGLSHGQTLRYVVIPQAIRKVTPALMNDFISMQKDVGLISVLGAVDAIRAAQIQQATTYNFTSYVVAGLLFVAFSWPFIRLSDWYTARLREREQTGGTV